MIATLVDYLNILFKSISKPVSFKYEFVGDILYIYGIGNNIAALYLLLHNRVANLCIYLGHNNKGSYLEVVATM